MFIIIIFDVGLICFSPVLCRIELNLIECSLQRDQSWDVTLHLGVSVVLQCSSCRVHASLFRLLLLQLCTNMCAEAFMVYRNSLLSRLAADLKQ